MHLWVENDLVLAPGSKLTWIWCDNVRPQIDRESSQIDVLSYVLEDYSVTVDSVAQLSIICNRTKEV